MIILKKIKMVYVPETSALNVQMRRNVEVFEVMWLRNMCGIRRRSDRMRSSIIEDVRLWVE